MLVSSRPSPPSTPLLSLPTAGPCHRLELLPPPPPAPGGRKPSQASHFPWGDRPDLSPAQTRGLPLFAPLQTRTSAPRTTAAASKTVSTPSAATSASAAAASSCTTTNTTARKVSGARAGARPAGHLPCPPGTSHAHSNWTCRTEGWGAPGQRCPPHWSVFRLRELSDSWGHLMSPVPGAQVSPTPATSKPHALPGSPCVSGKGAHGTPGSILGCFRS